MRKEESGNEEERDVRRERWKLAGKGREGGSRNRRSKRHGPGGGGRGGRGLRGRSRKKCSIQFPESKCALCKVAENHFRSIPSGNPTKVKISSFCSPHLLPPTHAFFFSSLY